jgi:hypothetical protein
MLRARHGWNWGQVRRHLTTPTGRWLMAADGGRYFRIEGVTVSRYAYRGTRSLPLATHESRLMTATVESPLPRNWHDGFGERPGNQTGGNTDTAPRADSTCAVRRCGCLPQPGSRRVARRHPADSWPGSTCRYITGVPPST